MADDTGFTWLHLSDLHFGHPDPQTSTQKSIVLRELINDVAERERELGTPDVVLVTGDIAWGGNKDHYDVAARWFIDFQRAASITAEKILLVPGNHDVDRAVVTNSRAVKVIHEALRNKPDELIHYIGNCGDVEIAFVKKFGAYAAFSRAFGSVPLAADRLFWNLRIPSPFGPIVACGLNTALLSFDNNEGQNSLALSLAQIETAIHAQCPTDLLLVLMHHPFEDLNDGPDLKAFLGNRPSMIFSGHVHREAFSVEQNVDGQAWLRLAAGPAHDSDLVPCKYSWGRLTAEGINLYPRVWQSTRSRFVSDRNAYPQIDDRHKLRIDLSNLPSLRLWLENRGVATALSGSSITPELQRVSRYEDPRGTEVLEDVALALERVINRWEPDGREYESYELTYTIKADGNGEEIRSFKVVNRSSRPIVMLEFAVTLDEGCLDPQGASFKDLSLSVRCEPEPNEVVILPLRNKPMEKSYALGFVPSILPGESRLISIWTFLPKAFLRFVSGENDEIEIGVKHERGISNVVVKIHIEEGAPAATLEWDKSTASYTSSAECREHVFHVSAAAESPLYFKAQLTPVPGTPPSGRRRYLA